MQQLIVYKLIIIFFGKIAIYHILFTITLQDKSLS